MFWRVHTIAFGGFYSFTNVFNVATNECLLKSGLGTSVAGLQAYYISGPKYCGFSTGIKTNKTSFRPVSILLQELVFKPSLCFYGCKKVCYD